MKHLFFVNSHMTFLTAKQTIKHFGFAQENCIYLLERSYPIEETAIKTLTFPFQNFPEDSFKATLFPTVLWKRMSKLDDFLTEITNRESFEIYYSQSEITYFYLIITHPKCSGYSFIEGGIGAYKPEYKERVSHPPSKLRSLYYYLMYKGRVPNQKFFYNTKMPKFKHCIGTHEMSFRTYDNQLNVGSPFEDKPEYRNIKHLFVIDCVVEFYQVQMETVGTFMKILFDRLGKENVSQLHFKLHPEHYRTPGTREKYLEMMEENRGDVEIIELGKTVILEHIARSSNAVFYVNISSLGLYANILGREVWSFARVLNRLEPKMDIKYKELGDKPIHYFE